jgi:hypothetical protein
LQAKFPFYSPFQFAGNTPIQAIDLDGAEEFHYLLTFDKQGKAQLTFISQNDYKYAEWTPTWTDWTKKTIHVNEEQRYYVHTGTYYDGTIENGTSVQFVHEEVTFFFGSTEKFNEGGSTLTPQDVQDRYSRLKWGTYAVKALNNIAEEARFGHIPGAIRSKKPTNTTNQQAIAVNGGNTQAAQANNSDAIVKPSTLRPGPYAKESIPAKSTAQTFSVPERAAINKIGRTNGCHTCGAMDPGTKSGNWVPDHQPSSAISPAGTPQVLLPHCINCSRKQGGEVSVEKKKAVSTLGTTN